MEDVVSGLLRHVVWWLGTDVSGDSAASIFTVSTLNLCLSFRVRDQVSLQQRNGQTCTRSFVCNILIFIFEGEGKLQYCLLHSVNHSPKLM
jgi:hypothetical protein